MHRQLALGDFLFAAADIVLDRLDAGDHQLGALDAGLRLADLVRQTRAGGGDVRVFRRRAFGRRRAKLVELGAQGRGLLLLDGAQPIGLGDQRLHRPQDFAVAICRQLGIRDQLLLDLGERGFPALQLFGRGILGEGGRDPRDDQDAEESRQEAPHEILKPMLIVGSAAPRPWIAALD